MMHIMISGAHVYWRLTNRVLCALKLHSDTTDCIVFKFDVC